MVDEVAIARFPAAAGAGVFGTVLEVTWNTFAASALSVYWLAAGGVLQVCNPPDTLWPLMRIARLRGAGIVYDQHDVASEMALARPTFRFLAPLMKWLEAKTVAAAHVIVTSSENSAVGSPRYTAFRPHSYGRPARSPRNDTGRRRSPSSGTWA